MLICTYPLGKDLVLLHLIFSFVLRHLEMEYNLLELLNRVVFLSTILLLLMKLVSETFNLAQQFLMVNRPGNFKFRFASK